MIPRGSNVEPLTTSTASDLERRFGIPGMAEVTEGNGGLPKVRITSPGAVGEMYLHGAHVTSWKPRGGEEALFVSAQSHWQRDRAIRGGVPVCFPWFGAKHGDPNAPAHGFVRTKGWQLESIVRDGDAVIVSMFTESDEATRRWWPADFRLVHKVRFGSDLRLELEMTNTGTSSLTFEEALHAYHRVGRVEEVRLRGLDTVHYLDKTDSNREKVQHGDVVLSSETDRVYLDTRDELALEDSVMHRSTHVAKENSRTTVVWNPWAQKARALSDFGDDEWAHMICIETSNVSKFAVNLGTGQQHQMRSIVRVADL
jgi:glucose-6-phosphate 1-epimerase